MADPASLALRVMWAMTIISIVMVIIRLYIRICIVRSVGYDDYMYLVTGFLSLLYGIFTQIACSNGYGSSAFNVTSDTYTVVILCELVTQTVAILGLTTVKLSVGAFLLRIVVKQWHRFVIWVVMAVLSVLCVAGCIIVWVSCTPVQSVWNPTVAAKSCINTKPIAFIFGVWCVIIDFGFVILPLIVVWTLQIPRRDKFSVVGSMSFGILAGICAIFRVYAMMTLSRASSFEQIMSPIVWAAAELATTMVCIVISTIRPLYLKLRGLSITANSRYKKNNYQKHGQGTDLADRGALQTVGGRNQVRATNKRSCLQNELDLGLNSTVRTYAPREQGSGEMIPGLKQHKKESSILLEEAFVARLTSARMGN